MTGHQDNPGTGQTLMGQQTHAADLKKLVKAVGVKEKNVKVIDPYDLKTNTTSYRNCIKRMRFLL